jgi:hypothetical protein
VSLPPEVPQPVDRPNAQPDPDTQLQQIEREMTGFERATLRWARVAVIMSALAALFVCLQWWEMHRGGVDTHALAEASGDAANAASDQADAAQQFSDTAEDINSRMSDAVDQLSAAADNAKASIRATQEAMRLDQRAWIVWAGTEGIPELDKPWTIRTHFTNSGRTPAKNVKVNCALRTAKADSALDFRVVQTDPTPTIIAPNDATTHCVLNPLTVEKVTQEALNVFSRKEIIIFIYGFVTYDDIFRKPHWVIFCHAMEPDGKSWIACKTHNDTGDGKLPDKWQKQ